VEAVEQLQLELEREQPQEPRVLELAQAPPQSIQAL
jgi:hypothetical protein